MTAPRRTRASMAGWLAACIAFMAAGIGHADEGEDAFEAWLQHQAAVEHWSADLVQTRTVAALAQPLESPGKVWFARPERFRWELGDPPRSIAVRRGEALTVFYPRLGRREEYTGSEHPAVQEALALLEIGMPDDPAGFRERYRLIAAERSGDPGAGAWSFRLAPRGGGSRRLIEQLDVKVASSDWRLLGTGIRFADGSVLRNRFSAHDFDPVLEDRLFDTDQTE